MRKSIGFSLLLMLVSFVPALLFASPDREAFTIIGQTDDYLDISFNLPDYKLVHEDKNGAQVTRVEMAGASYLFLGQEETLPVFSTNIAIPHRGSASLELSSIHSISQAGIHLSFDQALDNERSSGRLESGVYPASNVLLSEPMVFRDYRIVSLNVHAFQYDQDRSELRIAQNINLRINFSSRSSVNEISSISRASQAFERLYQGNILNYQSVNDRNQTYQQPVMLVIYGNYSDATYLSKVNEYIAWKKQKGYKVYSASTTTTGTSSTAIKAYIQNAYDTWEDRPEYIVLIGDASGTITVPTYSSYVDYYYTLLAGNDHLGDAIIGRISVSDTNQMINYMAKLMYHERDLNMANADHLNKMVLVGDSSSSGISTIYTNEYVYDVSSAIYPEYEYTKVYGNSPSSTTINAAINNGVAFYNYRGYIGMSGWPNTMSSIVVPNRLFHAIFITCNTGTFGSSTSTTESIVRHGTSTSLTGAITAIGMATSSTHTSMNNCLNVGIFHGLYPMGMRNMGEAMLNGKLYLNTVYGVSHPTQTISFSEYCNLIGDPTAEVFVGSPNTFNVHVPTSLPSGGNSLDFTVRNTANEIVTGAVASLTNSSGLQITAVTDESGRLIMNYPSSTTGSMTLTVTKDDFKPLVQNLSIGTVGSLALESVTIDDDQSGLSDGNNDATINAGETIELYASIKNNYSSSLSVQANINCTDSYVNLSTATINYGTINAGQTAQNASPILFELSPDTPDGHQFTITLSGTSANGSWSIPILLASHSAKLELVSLQYIGAPGNVINPGNVYPLEINLYNAGASSISNLSANLISHDLFFEVTDASGYYGNVPAGSSSTNSSNSFTVHARGQCIEGMVIPMELHLSNPQGFSQLLPFSVTIGNPGLSDPLGQDSYGYFIFDEGDTAYTQAPSYDWIGIAPAEGGNGTALALTDPGSSYDEGDQVGAVSITTVDLPFDFSFYGIDYDRVSISSNGFLSFGETTNSDWRNWRLPGAGGPNPMVAVFWDDIQLNTGSYVYTYYNTASHYYVVEWYNVISGYDRVTPLTFQAILYDPIFYPTHTGDGQIKLQYKVFNNIDTGSGQGYPHGNYATIGIKDHTGTIGLEYSYSNTYPTAALPLSHESAIFISTRPILPDHPYVMLENTVIYDENDNSLLEPGEIADLSIILGNMGLVEATGVSATITSEDHYAQILQSESYYGSIASLGTAAPQTYFAVQIDEDCPGGHELALTLRIVGDSGSWTYPLPLSVHTPELSFGELIISETNGNHNGILDPGENAIILIDLHNTGAVDSPSGFAALSANTPGLSITDASDTFTGIPGYGSAQLSFGVSASSAIAQGSLANLQFTATAGQYSADNQQEIEIGAPIEIQIGTGTSTQTYPIDRYYNYSAHEAIYLASEIQMAGSIKALAFYKGSGTDLGSIDDVSIYMKNTTSSSLASASYSLQGYSLVYSGSYPNNLTSGWMEINLDSMFEYDGVSNLSILTIKGYQQWISSYPRWNYTETTTNRARQSHSDSSAPTNLTATTALPNIRLKLFSADESGLYPPQNLVATPSHQSVSLNWEAPFTGNPSQYKIYRNSSYLASTQSLSYLDQNLVNGSTYSYWITADYNGEESEPCETASATPNAVAPTNLMVISGNATATLSWEHDPAVRFDEASFETATKPINTRASSNPNRELSGFRIYRNGFAIAETASLSYTDTGLTNGNSYNYYVTALYTNPAGESSPSNTVSAHPSMIEFVALGTGSSYTASNQMSPVNITYKSTHCQSVYTAGELNAAGVTGPIYITQLGYDVGSSPDLALVNYIVRMKHTSAIDAPAWDAANLETVYQNESWMPSPGDWDMLTFSTPFLWNGVDNILVDTAFGLVADWSTSGTLRYTNMTNGIRRGYSDYVDQTDVFSGGASTSFRPNIRFALQAIPEGPEIVLDTQNIDFGTVIQGETCSESLIITNDGDQQLLGSIQVPEGFEVLEQGRSANESRDLVRTSLPFSIEAGSSQNFMVSFVPDAIGSYEAVLLIDSNDPDSPSLSINLLGTCIMGTMDSPCPSISTIDGQMMLSWDAIENATGYHIYSSASPDGNFEMETSTTNTIYQIPLSNQRAFYRVIAHNEPPITAK